MYLGNRRLLLLVTDRYDFREVDGRTGPAPLMSSCIFERFVVSVRFQSYWQCVAPERSYQTSCWNQVSHRSSGFWSDLFYGCKFPSVWCVQTRPDQLVMDSRARPERKVLWEHNCNNFENARELLCGISKRGME